MIFDCNNGDMEVWRHLSDITELVVDESSALQLLMRFSTRSTT